ncbi:MAG: formylglycine-generating enzyme family protein [Planctomycetes bacterium]|nr:formylglycine-generating enzyme family protein [Planctomycetota bacterium]
MHPSRLLVPLASSLVAATAVAQTGRTMKLMAPVVLGQTASMVMEHSPSLAGRQFAMAMCSPNFPGALPISIPGVAVGVLRLDPLAFGVLGVGVLDASGVSPALQFLVPNNPLLVGASFDVQGADVDGAGLLTLTDNDLEIEVAAPPLASSNMVAIASGTFSMGSALPVGSAPYFNQTTSKPVHSVTISMPFWAGKYEVTQAEYQALMGSNPSHFAGVDLPVELVSWNQAVAYCDALSVQEAAAGRLPTGYEYRLPTEAEWEYCVRAGTSTEFHYGSGLACDQANIWYDSQAGSVCSSPGTATVGSYVANAWGLHDMHGNVSEWCLDSWDNSANYPAGSVADPYEASGPYRIVRGGGWSFHSYLSRSAFRLGGVPDFAHRSIGFRVVCAPVR